MAMRAASGRADQARRRRPRGPGRCAPAGQLWKLLLQARPELASALRPQFPHHETQGETAGRLGDELVEGEVRLVAAVEVRARPEPFKGLGKAGEVAAAHPARGERSDLALDHAPGRQQLERGGAFVHRPRAGPAMDAAAEPHLKHAPHLYRDHRLAHRRTAHPPKLGELPLAGQPGARRELPRGDQRSHLVGDVLVKPARLDHLKRHVAFPSGDGRAAWL